MSARAGIAPPGSAEQDYYKVHEGRRYDIEIDGQDDADANADRILRLWRSGRRVSEFATNA